ncbi:MAG: hypothetical protein RBU21_02815 [FCB group bacterium]|jgi:hypothetical protein|nr:hypothetical protein [FCB group bacterium]
MADYKDAAATQHAEILHRVLEKLRYGGLPYRKRRELSAAIRSMPDGAEAPRAMNTWLAANQQRVERLLSA